MSFVISFVCKNQKVSTIFPLPTLSSHMPQLGIPGLAYQFPTYFSSVISEPSWNEPSARQPPLLVPEATAHSHLCSGWAPEQVDIPLRKGLNPLCGYKTSLQWVMGDKEEWSWASGELEDEMNVSRLTQSVMKWKGFSYSRGTIEKCCLVGWPRPVLFKLLCRQMLGDSC